MDTEFKDIGERMFKGSISKIGSCEMFISINPMMVLGGKTKGEEIFKKCTFLICNPFEKYSTGGLWERCDALT